MVELEEHIQVASQSSNPALDNKTKSEVHDERYAEREEKNKYLIDVYFHGIECTDIPALIFMYPGMRL